MRVPTATYRIQLHRDFGFAQLSELIPYLDELGITDIYASPIAKARAASQHGYDVVDPAQINPEIGSAEEFAALADLLRVRGMGWLQDIVPNHMAYDSENRMLMDVLENGPESEFADYFDIEWNHPFESMRGKILAPCLGRFYGQCLESGELQLEYGPGGLGVRYFQQIFPIKIGSYNQVLSPSITELRRRLGREHPDLIKWMGILYTLKNLPAPEESRERALQITFVKSMLWELYTSNPAVKAFIDANLARFNGVAGDPQSYDALDQLLGEQYYRLSFWKVATEEINYRRFFNINELISLRIEEPRAFEAVHAMIFQLVRERRITGLRIDHIDGLYDPAAYLKQIEQRLGPFYVVVEKITGLDERLPEQWPVCGTTGYDFLNYLNGIFCQTKNEGKISHFYERFTGLDVPFEDLVREKKRLLIGKHMAGDVDCLAHLLKHISSRDRFGVDITLYGLKRALVEVLTFFPVYRSYISPERYSDQDRKRMIGVMKQAKDLNPGLVNELDFIEKFLLLDYGARLTDAEKSQWVHFIMRLQQLTGPLMAKGFEDTTLYIYNRLLSLNEVGGDPGRFGITPQAFHRFCEERAERWPHALNATSTHDTKRGEDVRARINVLSEIPAEWKTNVTRWNRLNRRHKVQLKNQQVPDRNDEYFFYQSLVGALPMHAGDYSGFVERVKVYMVKAVREAKVHTEWLKPDHAYEQGFLLFIDKVLERSEANPFLREFVPWAQKVAHFGALNSLSQTLVKITAPGVPDFYQGSELWDLHFVDPDNRAAVDFQQRMRLLHELGNQAKAGPAELDQTMLRDWSGAKAKLFVIHRTLALRRSAKELFQSGAYLPLTVLGRRKDHVIAFARRFAGRWSLTAVPRFMTQLCATGELPLGAQCWDDTVLILPQEAPERWVQVFTQEAIAVSAAGDKKVLPLREAYGSFPVALLFPDGFVR